jgi:hypothetical protein
MQHTVSPPLLTTIPYFYLIAIGAAEDQDQAARNQDNAVGAGS